MKLKVHGISLTLSTDETNLWWDSDKHHDGAGKKGFGIVLSLKAGWVLRPVGKLWKKGFWTRNKDYNPWVSGNHWFVIKFPCIVPFFSIAIGNYGLYAGFKTYGVDWPEYASWLDSKYIADGNKALAPSFSMRRTRI